jgi:hypothetical protein
MKMVYIVMGLLGIMLLAGPVSGEVLVEQDVKPVPCKIILYGGYKGEWSSDDGTKAGKLKGVYGVIKCGDRKTNFFRGKWMSTTSTEVRPGFMFGTYGDGKFKGFWTNGNVRGSLKGEYGRDESGDGYFKGIWRTEDGSVRGQLKGIWMPFTVDNLPKIPPSGGF